MSKKIDWNLNPKALSGNRGKYNSYAEMMQIKQQQADALEKSKERFKTLEPILKKSLLDHMVQRKVIKVLAPITYHTDHLEKSENSASFGIREALIPAGTELIYQSMCKTMGTWLFKSILDGKEYEIYQSQVLALPGGASGQYTVQNPAFYGLLLSTNIYKEVMEAIGEEV